MAELESLWKLRYKNELPYIFHVRLHCCLG